MKKRSLYIVCAIAALFMSCTKEYEGVFEKSPDERTSAAVNEFKEALLSSENGWLVNYYPNPEVLGGFTYVFKFDKNGTVKMNWGISERPDDQSLYSIKMIEKPILSFDTYSIFSKMTDPDMGVPRKGFGGENELALIRISPNKDTIYLQERISKSSFVLVKASATAWTDLKKYPAMGKVLERENEKVVPFYYNLTVEGWSTPVTMTYFSDQQRVNLFYKLDGKDIYTEMGINFTPDGFQFQYPLEINGIKVQSFKYDEALGLHIVADKGVKGCFGYSTSCASVIKGATKKFFGLGTFGFSTTRLSPKMMERFKNINPDGEIDSFGYSPYGGDYSYIRIYFKDWTRVHMGINNFEQISENSVVMHFGSYPDPNDWWSYDDGFSERIMNTDLGKQLSALLFSPKGWTVVPLSFVEYGAQCVIVSNEDPEMYITCLE